MSEQSPGQLRAFIHLITAERPRATHQSLSPVVGNERPALFPLSLPQLTSCIFLKDPQAELDSLGVPPSPQLQDRHPGHEGVARQGVASAPHGTRRAEGFHPAVPAPLANPSESLFAQHRLPVFNTQYTPKTDTTSLEGTMFPRAVLLNLFYLHANPHLQPAEN